MSPESSLARLDGCDGYIAQVWTGTARTPNHFRGKMKERTFETAFLEYGSMQNLVRATGRSVWYLNDPIEDNPRHDWTDYQTNWESTLVASLLQPEVWQFEVAPWPERIFGGKYPRTGKPEERKSIPPAYATELQVVMQALTDMKQTDVKWDCGTQKIGVLISDSMMFQREQPTPSDPNMAQFYGLALPLLKRGIPVTPVQLENVALPGFLDEQRVLFLTYQGQKPLEKEVHSALAMWVRKGGVLVMVDDDSDPYNRVREWWNDEGKNQRIPRQDLFAALGITDESIPQSSSPKVNVEKGAVVWLRESPVKFALSVEADQRLIKVAQSAVEQAGMIWKETNFLALKRGPYVIGAGLDESIPGAPKTFEGKFVNLFDPKLELQTSISLTPGQRVFLLDLKAMKLDPPKLLASACKALPVKEVDGNAMEWMVEGVGETNAIMLISTPKPPVSIKLEETDVMDFRYDAAEKLLHVKFANEARPRQLVIRF